MAFSLKSGSHRDLQSQVSSSISTQACRKRSEPPSGEYPSHLPPYANLASPSHSPSLRPPLPLPRLSPRPSNRPSASQTPTITSQVLNKIF